MATQTDGSPLSISAWPGNGEDLGTPSKQGEGRGLWTRDEHQAFLNGILLNPSGPWKVIAAQVGSRTARQTMTHAQKYRQKIARRLRNVRQNAQHPLPNNLDASSSRYNALLSNDEQFNDSIVATALAIQAERELDLMEDFSSGAVPISVPGMDLDLDVDAEMRMFDGMAPPTAIEPAFEECIDFLIAKFHDGAPLP